MSKPDYYKVLGLEKNASNEEIKKAYKKLAMKWHPDRNQDNIEEAEANFKEINEAHEVLSNPEKRAQYDQFGHDSPNQGGFNPFAGGARDFADLFRRATGGFGTGGNGFGRQQQNSDVTKVVNISLEEAHSGVTLDVSYNAEIFCDHCDGTGSESKNSSQCLNCGGTGLTHLRSGMSTFIQTCGNCGGSGNIVKDPCTACYGSKIKSIKKTEVVKLSPGFMSNQGLGIRGKGNQENKDLAPGDLILRIFIDPHPDFEMGPNGDLGIKKGISVSKMILGATIEVKDIEGKTLEVDIPPLSKDGQILRIKNRGLNYDNGKLKRGNLLILLQAIWPDKKLSAKAKEALQAFDKEV